MVRPAAPLVLFFFLSQKSTFQYLQIHLSLHILTDTPFLFCAFINFNYESQDEDLETASWSDKYMVLFFLSFWQIQVDQSLELNMVDTVREYVSRLSCRLWACNCQGGRKTL